ncbi:MAG: 50S ribosomal protein L9 [bacterium]|nr:50S ribosomal protein L9 [bacterium]
MKIILLKDIAKVGRKYETKDISDGYAVNLLIPKGLAVAATPDAVKRLETEKKKMDGERKIHEELLLKNLSELDGVTITIKDKANEKGHLFAGLHSEAIAEEVQKQTRLQIDPSLIQIEHPIKELGNHPIEVKGAGKSVKFNLIIEAR